MWGRYYTCKALDYTMEHLECNSLLTLAVNRLGLFLTFVTVGSGSAHLKLAFNDSFCLYKTWIHTHEFPVEKEKLY